jgi:alpha-ribazole phosphatase
VIDQRLLEMDFGDWEGKKWDDIPEHELNEWMQNYQEISPPGGESMNAIILRSKDFIDHIKGQNLNKVALITHAGIIRILLSQYQNIPAEKMFEIKIGFGEVLSIDI